MECLEDQVRNTDPNSCFYTVTGNEFDPRDLQDNCEIASITNDYNSSESLEGAQISDGTVITWTLTDVNSNATTCTFTISVKDDQAPQIPELPELSAECSITLTPPTTTDNCDSVVTAATGVDLTFEESGSVFWIFTDSSGNSSEPVEQIITIADTQAPIPNVTSLPRKSITGCQISSLSELDIPTATDACDGTITGKLSDDFQFPYSFFGINTVTWEYIDESGNITTQEQEIQLNPVTLNGGDLSGTFNGTEFQNQIDISSCGASIAVDLQLSGKNGTIVQWEKFAVNEGFWEVISNTSNNHTANFSNGALESTYYRVLVRAGTCTEYSNSFYIRALPAGDAPTVTNLDPDNKYCLGDDVNLLAESNYLATQPAIPSDMSPGDFNQGQLNTQDPRGWLTDGEPGGFTAGGNSKKPRNWSGTNNHEFGGIEFDSEDKKFAIAQGNFFNTGSGNGNGNGNGNGGNGYTGNIPTTLETPILDLTNAASASLEFDQAFYFANSDVAIIEISTDGGNSYSTLRVMHAANSGILKWFTAGTAQSTGASTASKYLFSSDNTSISLDEYIGESEVRIRWSFTGTSDRSVWALDNIFINNQVPVDTDLEWTNGIGNPDENPIETGETSIPLNFIPESPGAHQYGATALINGCRTYSEEGTDLVDVLVSYAYAGENIIQTEAECGQNSIQLNAYDNTITANENFSKGAYPGKPEICKTCDNPGTGDIGTWSWEGASPSCTEVSFSDINDPNATFTAGPGTYELTWTVDDCSSTITATITNCDQIDFDGVDDYVDFEDNYQLNGAFSIEVWIKPESLNGTQTIFSKRDANFSGNARGYDLRMVNGKVSFHWDKSGSIVSPVSIQKTDRWYHIALTHSAAGEYKLYIDGIRMKLAGGGSPGNNNFSAILGAMATDDAEPTNHFNGWMEELRIWNVALSEVQLHQMMNQQINESGTNKVRGEEIPVDITNLNWSDLVGYYRMDNIECGNIVPYTLNGQNHIGYFGGLRNISTSQQKSAPLPYISKENGSWEDRNTWEHPDVWTFPNDTGLNGDPINWNIARISHDIVNTKQDITLLGLLSEGEELLMDGSVDSETGHGLTITNYLKLDGIINLDGYSQLIQTEGSILAENSSGFIEIDQQGTDNSFNYNYWTSPVSNTNGDNNAGFTLTNVLYDGTNAEPQNISFNNQYHWADGNYTGNTRISTYWLYVFYGQANQYSEWKKINENTLIPPGYGYTMKGTRGYVPVTNLHNYTFLGKPHNGDIYLKIGSEENLLLGNPYPSAIDANMFIQQNLGSTNGSIYFWDHFGPENSHYLVEYVGGYAAYNKSGAVPAISNDDRINATDQTGTKKPGNYIPVGQAFFVSTVKAGSGTSTSSGGTIKFSNSQRLFVTEKNKTDSQFLMSEEATKSKSSQAEYSKDNRYKIRLKYHSPKGYRREILATADGYASNGFDIGYDAPLIENNVEDMYWLIEETGFVIQAVPDFNPEQILPLGIRIGLEGEFTIGIKELENIDAKSFEIYLHDKETDEYFDLLKDDFTATATPGDYDNRYEIVFQAPQEIVEEEFDFDHDFLDVAYFDDFKEIQLMNPDLLNLQNAELYSLSGQKLFSFGELNSEKIQNLKLRQQLSTAVYILKVYTEDDSYSKKLIITK